MYPRGRVRQLGAARARLLEYVPSVILDSYPIRQWGLSEGLALLVGDWRARILAGEIPAHDMRASLIPVAGLTSAMLEALLRGTRIDQRGDAFEALAEESHRILTGRPHAVIIQSGIV